MEKYKIPASITLAQGLLETGGGQSILAQQGNNHFGIKCKENWTGKTMKYTDDAPNECFRVYDDPKQSYEDHSVFLVNRPFYRGLFDLDPKDYKAWAHGLKKAGYATNPKYAYILISKIEKYRLFEFDNVNKEQVTEKLLALYPDLVNDKEFLAKNLPTPKKKKMLQKW
jgi:flagellum-specific peptidoglycan hydrolase FlgJ